MAWWTRSGPRTRQPRTNEKQIKKKSAAKKRIKSAAKERIQLDEVMDLFYTGEDKLDKKETTTKKKRDV